MKEHFQFLHGFFKNPLKVGAISPSSPALARKMVEDVRANEDNVVLEIGCGTGAITKFIRDLVPTRDSYLGIEIDHEFVCQLNRDFPTMQIVCEDACNATQLLADKQLGRVGYIVSGLPFVVLPKEVSDGILKEVDKLMKDGCVFRTFQYAHGFNLPPAWRFREELNARYGKVERSSLVLKNVPPAYTLTWKS